MGRLNYIPQGFVIRPPFSVRVFTGAADGISPARRQRRGIPVSRELPSRLRRARQYWLGNPDGRFRNLAAVARDRADILAACHDRLSGAVRQRAALGRARYLELASRLELRAELYEDRRASARVRRLQRLQQGGAYRGGSAWEFTRGALIKDTILGVVLRPLLS